MSMDPWIAGFRSKREVFEWVGTSRFFDPRRFRSTGEGFRKVKPERKMYHEFVEWAMEKALAATGRGEEPSVQRSKAVTREDALEYFGKKKAFEALVRERTRRLELKEVFSGHKVRDWTDLGNHWKGVKLVMDGVRERHGGDEGVWKIYDREGEEGVKKVVVQVKEDLLEEIDRKQSTDNLAADMARIDLDQPSGEVT